MPEASQWRKFETGEIERAITTPEELLSAIPGEVTRDNLIDFARAHGANVCDEGGGAVVKLKDKNYMIIGEICGGTSVVYFAYNQGNPQECVIIKISKPNSDEAPRVVRERLFLERSFFDLHNNDGARYFPKLLDEGRAEILGAEKEEYGVIELLPGIPLSRIMSLYPHIARTEHFASAIGFNIMEALRVVHEDSLVLRDIDPANVIVTRPRRNQPFVKIPDLNGAYRPGSTLTQPGVVIATSLSCVAPELLTTRAHPSPQSDYYALGVLLFEIVTGRKNLVGASSAAITASLPNPNSELGRLIISLLAPFAGDRPIHDAISQALLLGCAGHKIGRHCTGPVFCRNEPKE